MSQFNESSISSDSKSNTNNRVTIQEVIALASQFFALKNLEIINFDFKPFSSEKLGYLGVHELLTIEARDHDGDPETPTKTLTFFVKAVVQNCNAFDELIFKEEFKFYHEAMPQLLENFKFEPWAAKCYLAKENFLVLEDLKSKGFKIVKGPFNVDQMKSALICIARFHACSILLEEKLQKPLSGVYLKFFKEKVFLNDEGFSWKWLLTGIEVVEAIAVKLDLNPKYSSIAYKSMLEKIKPIQGENHVLCHADLWSNNIMFKEDNNGLNCRLVDFQMVVYTSYAIDLVQLIYLNTTREVRERFEREFIKIYHTALKETLKSQGFDDNKIISLQEVIRDYNEKRICGLVTAVQFFPIALLNKNLSEEYTKDAVKLECYMYNSRKEFVLKAMKLDEDYRIRNEEVVQELIDYAQSIDR